jgi:hypothetical protein
MTSPFCAADPASESDSTILAYETAFATPRDRDRTWGMGGHHVTLDAFLSDNRAEIIKRIRAKVASRSSPQTSAIELKHGVPMFLSQPSARLKETAEGKDGRGAAPTHSPSETPATSQSAGEHGLSPLKFGFTIEQVVHDDGNVCQANAELAQELGATLSIVDFQTLNRCLDNAIAGAVTSWSRQRERNIKTEANEGKKSDALRRRLLILDQAQGALEALRAGTVGIGGATREILHRSLIDLHALIDKGEYVFVAGAGGTAAGTSSGRVLSASWPSDPAELANRKRDSSRIPTALPRATVAKTRSLCRVSKRSSSPGLGVSQ